jgi:protein-tyrosine phosphatase
MDIGDSPTQDLTEFIKQGNKFIDEGISKGLNVLVHCAAGSSRSASIVIAYMMWKFDWSLAKAYKYVKAKRPICQPNDGFMEQLSKYQPNKLKKKIIEKGKQTSKVK